MARAQLAGFSQGGWESRTWGQAAENCLLTYPQSLGAQQPLGRPFPSVPLFVSALSEVKGK